MLIGEVVMLIDSLTPDSRYYRFYIRVIRDYSI